MSAATHLKEFPAHIKDFPTPVKKDGFTCDDIRALPEGKRAELINGHWYDMATPNTEHQRIVSVLTWKLCSHIEDHDGDCQVFPAPYAVFLTESEKNWLEPDIIVVCDPDKIKEDGCHGAPDLVVEVTSPSTIKRDMGVKLMKYRTDGVKEYWLINPDTKTTSVFSFDPDVEKVGGNQFAFTDELTSELYPAFSIRLSDYL
ncbi:MAG: Uma2 family endonuclease [Lachnospiraceae bacterium]|nr:Uma2 family endonuclease [Lachnospiraceae bacterium]